MGRGDKKTAKGKRARGSYGVTRKRSEEKASLPNPSKKVKKVAPIKTVKAESAPKVQKKKEVVAKKETAEKKPTVKKVVAEKKIDEKKPVAKKPAVKKAAPKKTE
jgi:ribosomal small subunit protein bTHX